MLLHTLMILMLIMSLTSSVHAHVGTSPTYAYEPAAAVTHYTNARIPHGLDERHKITYHLFDTQMPGPHIVIIAGIHGNEPAPRYAAQYIVDHFHFEQGRFLIIPVASLYAATHQTRNIQRDDLNRQFHNPDPRGNAAQRVAASIIDIITDFEPDAIIDLHKATPGRLVNTLVHHQDNPQTAALTRHAIQFATDAINDSALVNNVGGNRPFREFPYENFPGTTSREFSYLFGVPSLLLETGLHHPMSLRVAQHLFLIDALVTFFTDTHAPE
ncbi:MAG: succinylglutamate desuccinylase/aspartoacylase family protein [Defluviitaleaceae bacterium]|nr:succinylglutamate desuccinylase/aspartoacylase family protein [Defluviitaleaceae bacterium]